MQLRLHQRQLRKAAVGRSNMEPGLWPVAPNEFKSGRGVSVQREAPEFFSWQVCCLQFTVHYGVGATVCGYALGGSEVMTLDRGIDTAVRLWAPTYISSLLQPPTPLFFENSSDLHQSQDWPWRRLGGSCPQLPPYISCPPLTTLMEVCDSH